MPGMLLEEPKKKKVGLIIGVILCLAAAIGCGVAAAIIATKDSGDTVAKAISKLMSSEAPANVAINGNIEIVPTDSSSMVEKYDVSIDSKIALSSRINTTTATITANLKGTDNVSFSVNELYGATGDLFFKIDSVSELIDNQNPPANEPATNCENSENCEEVLPEKTPTNNGLTAFLPVIEAIEGEWLRLPIDEISNTTNNVMADNNLVCFTNFVNEVGQNSNILSKIYNENPFIFSNKNNVSVASKQYPVLAVGINTKTLSSFADALKDTDLVKNLSTCLGNKSTTINSDELTKLVEKMPALYVEIDENNNFTRLYFVADVNNGEATATVDLDFTYPANINVSEPDEYRDLSTGMEGLYSEMYDNGAELEGAPGERREDIIDTEAVDAPEPVVTE